MAMVIASMGVLAFSNGTIFSLNANSIARERVAATNLALDVIEAWQASSSDALPTLQCANNSVLLTVGTAAGTQASCVLLSQEVKVSYTITIGMYAMQAPLPPVPAAAPAPADLYAGLRITALAIDRNTPTTIYAGTHGNGLFKSTDSGGSWSKIQIDLKDTFDNVNTIIQLPGTGHVFIAGTDIYTLANSNYGIWQRLAGTSPNALPSSTQSNVLSLTTDAYGGLYAGMDYYASTSTGGVYKTTNTGSSWSASSGVDPYTLYSVAGDSYTSYTVNAMVADSYSYVYAGTSAGVFFSANAGSHWFAASTAPGNINIYALAVNPSSGSVYAGTGNNVYESTDKGDTWSSKIIAASPFRALAFTPEGALYSGSNQGVYLGIASKVSDFNYQSSLRTYSLAVPSIASTNIVYAGTDNGLFKSTNSGGNWSRSDLGTGQGQGDGIGLVPKEKVVRVSWTHKGAEYKVLLTHVTPRDY